MSTQPIIPPPTGNPLLDNPQTRAALTAQMAVKAAPQPQGAVMPPGGSARPPAQILSAASGPPGGAISLPPGNVPALPPTPKPTIIAPRGTVEGDQAERSRLLGSGSGISQIAGKIENSGLGQKHSVLGKVLGIGAQGLAQLGNLALDTTGLGRGLALAIPGTAEHHALEVRNATSTVNNDEAEAAKEAEAQEAQARTAQANEATNLLEHPRPSYQPLDTSSGIVDYDKGTGTTVPLTGENGQPLQPYVKPGNREHVTIAGPDGKPAFAAYDPQTGSYYDAGGTPIANAQPYVKPGNSRAVTLDIPGQGRVAGKADAQGNLLTEDGKPVPAGTTIYQQPNYGQMVLPTKTATFIGPDGVPREYQWNEATQTYDKPLGISASNAYGHEVAQAGAVQRSGEQLIADIQAHAKDLGTLSAWVQKHGLNTPIANPELAQLQAELGTFAALQPSMHGFRGGNALQTFDNIIGGLQKNPDATIASIRGILKTSSAINPDLKQPGAKAAPQTHVFNSAAWAKANPKGDLNAAKAYARKQGYEVQ